MKGSYERKGVDALSFLSFHKRFIITEINFSHLFSIFVIAHREEKCPGVKGDFFLISEITKSGKLSSGKGTSNLLGLVCRSLLATTYRSGGRVSNYSTKGLPEPVIQ